MSSKCFTDVMHVRISKITKNTTLSNFRLLLIKSIYLLTPSFHRENIFGLDPSTRHTHIFVKFDHVTQSSGSQEYFKSVLILSCYRLLRNSSLSSISRCKWCQMQTWQNLLESVCILGIYLF